MHASPSPQVASQRRALRQQLKQARAGLTEAEQRQAAEQLVTMVLAQPWLEPCSTIAVYYSYGAELDTAPLIKALWKAGKTVCLPVLHPFSAGHLLMLRYDQSTTMRTNKYGIIEPVLDARFVVPMNDLDCIFTPLVGFDPAGNRLGMGGGYYDRTLSAWAAGHHPVLEVCGLAHECQFVAHIPVEPWDVPLPRVITPTRSWRFPSHTV